MVLLEISFIFPYLCNESLYKKGNIHYMSEWSIPVLRYFWLTWVLQYQIRNCFDVVQYMTA